MPHDLSRFKKAQERDYETALAHAFRRGFEGLVEQTSGSLLGVDVFLGNREICVVVYAAAEGLLDLVGALPSAQHCGSSFADADRVAHSVACESEDFGALAQELTVGEKSGADVDAVDAVDENLGTGNRLEILTFGYDGPGHAGPALIGDRFHERIGSHDWDAQAAETVGLDGEAAFVGHGLDDGLDFGACLHGLV